MLRNYGGKDDNWALIVALIILMTIFLFSVLSGRAMAQQVASVAKEASLSAEEKLLLLEARVALLDKTNSALVLRIQFLERVSEVERAQRAFDLAVSSVKDKHTGYHLDAEKLKLFEIPQSKPETKK